MTIRVEIRNGKYYFTSRDHHGYRCFGELNKIGRQKYEARLFLPGTFRIDVVYRDPQEAIDDIVPVLKEYYT